MALLVVGGQVQVGGWGTAQVLHGIAQQAVLVQQPHLAERVGALAAGGQEGRQPATQTAPQHAHVQGGGRASTGAPVPKRT
ncbi:hypothetical protein ACIRRI_54975 [Streptomyces mirabilis]|uniref:hypothetical protein n=1 Tax=Streptomyces mirabilis TaxID=68239 RepID=UPI0037F705E2